jgi:hypothetical protein
MLASSWIVPRARWHISDSHALGTARKACPDFFALWKDADPDIPIVKQAQREYAELK